MKKHKISRIFNIIDVAVILFVVLAVVTVAANGFFKDNGSKDKNIMLEYKVLISGIRIFSVDAIKPDMNLLDGETGSSIGTITDTKIGPSTTIIKLSNGSIKEIEVPDRYSVTVTVKCSGTESELGYYANGRQIAPGGDIKLVSTGLSTSGIIISVKETE